MDDQRKYEEAKVFYLAALEGRRKVLGKEHKKTLMSLNNSAANLAKLLCWTLKSKEKTRALISSYPVLLEDTGGFKIKKKHQDRLKRFIG